MKKVLIVSDSHGNRAELENLIIEGNFAEVFYLGDGLRDIKHIEDLYNIKKVAGNCDYFSTEPKLRIEVVEKVKFLLTHGDLFKVKQSYTNLINECVVRNINVCCFGHTHRQHEEIVGDLLLLNPGTFSMGHYIVIEVDNGKIIDISKK